MQLMGLTLLVPDVTRTRLPAFAPVLSCVRVQTIPVADPSFCGSCESRSNVIGNFQTDIALASMDLSVCARVQF